MTNKVKTTRNLKVIGQSGYRYQATPTVVLCQDLAQIKMRDFS